MTVGGAIFGYCATGRLNKAMTPTNTVTIAITDAKIGRSMKNLGIPPIRILSATIRVPHCRSPVAKPLGSDLRLNCLTGMEKLQSFSNHAILRLQAFEDCELAVVDLSDRDFAVFDFIVAVDHIGKSLPLINSDRAFRHEESLMRLIERQAHTQTCQCASADHHWAQLPASSVSQFPR